MAKPTPFGGLKPMLRFRGPRLPRGGSGNCAMSLKPARSTAKASGPSFPETVALTSTSTSWPLGLKPSVSPCTSIGPSVMCDGKLASNPPEPVKPKPERLERRIPSDSSAEMPSAPRMLPRNESASSGAGLTTMCAPSSCSSTKTSISFGDTSRAPMAKPSFLIASRLASGAPSGVRSGTPGAGLSFNPSPISGGLVVTPARTSAFTSGGCPTARLMAMPPEKSALPPIVRESASLRLISVAPLSRAYGRRLIPGPRTAVAGMMSSWNPTSMLAGAPNRSSKARSIPSGSTTGTVAPALTKASSAGLGSKAVSRKP